jgi:hypothetical protein
VLPRHALRALLARGIRPVASPKKKDNRTAMSETAAALEIVPPPKKEPARRKRSHVDHFRTDDEEHAELAVRAREAGMSVDAYCRWKTLDDPGPRSRRAAPSEESRLTAQHHIAVNRLGANINQGIRALNEIALKAPEAQSRDQLADEILGLREMLRLAVRAVDETLAASRAALGR